MLAPVSNEVVFKKAFTDPIVLGAFVEDLTGQVFKPGKIETEKRFDPPIGNVDIRLDIFAESQDQRAQVELQRRRYGDNLDRFLGYHCAGVLDQQRSHKDYSIAKKVFTIVVLTSPYRQTDKSGKLVEDPLLISSTDPRNHLGEQRFLYGHQLILLNPAHRSPDLPPRVQRWLDFFLASLKKEEQQGRWADYPVIDRAAKLIEFDNMSAQEVAAVMDKADEERAMAVLENDRDLLRTEIAELDARVADLDARAAESEAKAAESEAKAAESQAKAAELEARAREAEARAAEMLGKLRAAGLAE